MAKLLHSTAPDFSVMFSQFLAQREEIAGDVRGVVSDILAQIRAHGDDALIEYTQKFDRIRLPSGIALTQSQIASHAAKCDSAVREALTLAAQRIYDFHVTQKPQDTSYTDDAGVKLGVRWRPISDVGLYVPGGMASYPSSVLMNAIPAKVAGAQRLVMVVPTPDGQINAAVMAAAQIAQIDEIYPIGGAQAVGA
ncbi:MAG: histidinol dehydrogenase, partial [Alphaproteobacteria bacterium]|nr:histidinol dehydrogenase [Alphaproteobacteria bacterium]